MINTQQLTRLVIEFQQRGSIGMSAMKSGMDRKTARKYLKNPERLSQPRPVRGWRTRVNMLAEIWLEAEPRLRAAPVFDAHGLLGHLRRVRRERVLSEHWRTCGRHEAGSLQV